MQYGSTDWASWVLPEEEAIKHIKFACVLLAVCRPPPRTDPPTFLYTRWEHGITTFDTANCYSNGVSETILGKAIKQLNLPREELVIMTKVRMEQRAEPERHAHQIPCVLGVLRHSRRPCREFIQERPDARRRRYHQSARAEPQGSCLPTNSICNSLSCDG